MRIHQRFGKQQNLLRLCFAEITCVVFSRSLTSHLSELSLCLRFNILCNIAGVKLSFNIPLSRRLSSLPYNKSCPECVDPLPVVISIATKPTRWAALQSFLRWRYGGIPQSAYWSSPPGRVRLPHTAIRQVRSARVKRRLLTFID
jgi:hypothetical protein